MRVRVKMNHNKKTDTRGVCQGKMYVTPIKYNGHGSTIDGT